MPEPTGLKKRDHGGLLMTHLVGGYPDARESLRLARAMVRAGADLLEVQIPFTDPLADGPAIMEACDTALKAGATPKGCFRLVEEMTREWPGPVVIMSYLNLILRMGPGAFAEEAGRTRTWGLLVPDMPLDSPEGEALSRACKARNIHLIPVVSPSMDPARMERVLALGSGFVYATARIGITGSVRNPSPLRPFFADLRRMTSMTILAGFGLSGDRETLEISRLADGIVVGSHLIRLYGQGGADSVARFIQTLKRMQGEGT